MQDHKTSFDQAMAVTRAGNLFTTHTAVAAGFDRFDPGLMHKYLRHYAEDESPSPWTTCWRGNQDGNPAEDFNMAYLAVRGSGQINGVSQLHGQVSRHIFSRCFPDGRSGDPHRVRDQRDPRTDMGLSGSRWVWTIACGKKRWLGDELPAEDVRRVSDEQLWQMRNIERKG